MAEHQVSPRLRVRAGIGPADFPIITAIRRQVFVIEQGVATSVEPDNVDRAAHHALGLIGDRVVAVGRLHISGSEGQIAWVAVLPEFRRHGFGQAIMLHLLEIARASGVSVVLLNAQTHALRFYQRLGFETIGDRFLMGGIEHQMMSWVRPPD
jgi:predicted GNAT family N-acyltransferase